MLDDLRDAFGPQLIQRLANSPNFITFDRFCMRLPKNLAGFERNIDFEPVVAYHSLDLVSMKIIGPEGVQTHRL
jgi:hypothetical protein